MGNCRCQNRDVESQLARMKLFDDLIGNSDRNKGNLLVDADWHIFLIDHSRAFVPDSKLPQELQNIDRRLWTRMLALDEAGLKTTMGTWLDSRQIQAPLRRRDAMKKKIDALSRSTGHDLFRVATSLSRLCRADSPATPPHCLLQT